MVEQYRRFVDNGGYGEERFWRDSWSIKAKEGGDTLQGWDEQWEHLNRPVTGRPWYEVRAYCEWLREPAELPFRLPTKKERAGVVGEA